MPLTFLFAPSMQRLSKTDKQDCNSVRHPKHFVVYGFKMILYNARFIIVTRPGSPPAKAGIGRLIIVSQIALRT